MSVRQTSKKNKWNECNRRSEIAANTMISEFAHNLKKLQIAPRTGIFYLIYLFTWRLTFVV